MFFGFQHPAQPIGAVEWTRRLRVGEARLVGGGFVGAGPSEDPHYREYLREFGDRPGAEER